MPGISDPGHDLIVAALQHAIEVTVVPGPSALLSALVLSGLPTDEFTFLGFPPRKAGERKKFLERALTSDKTIILFEAANRLIHVLEPIGDRAPDRKVVVARELTKKFEQVLRGTPSELLEHFQKYEPKGECVVLIEGSSRPLKPAKGERLSPAELVGRLMREGMPKKEAMREAARRLGLSRRVVYEAFLKKKEQQ
jgi:16S rRNA (cytidine1402-2'-O)-methyltransferase